MRAVVIDSGVLLALWDPNDTQHQAATAVLEHHLTNGTRLIVPVTALSEVLVGAFRATPYAVRTIENFMSDLVGEVRPADQAVGRAAARLLADHPTLPMADALLLSDRSGDRRPGDPHREPAAGAGRSTGPGADRVTRDRPASKRAV